MNENKYWMGTIMGINIADVEFKKILGTEGLRKKIKNQIDECKEYLA